MKIAVAAVVAVLCMACVASAFYVRDDIPAIPTQFTANITLVEGGQKYTGYIISDPAAQRFFRFLKQFNQSTYEFQEFGSTRLYTYTIIDGDCTCTSSANGVVVGIFAQLAAARKSKLPCNSTGGVLYVNDIFRGLHGVPTNSYCIDGATPKYIDMGGMGTSVLYFDTFTAERPAGIPIEPMASVVNQCAGGCI